MPLELNTRKPAATMRIALSDPETGEALDAYVVLAGPYSAEGIAAKRAAREALPEDASLDAVLDEVAIRSTVGFGNLTINGDPVAERADQATVRSIYGVWTWMLAQARAGQWKVEGFFEKPSASSTPTPDTSASSAS